MTSCQSGRVISSRKFSFSKSIDFRVSLDTNSSYIAPAFHHPRSVHLSSTLTQNFPRLRNHNFN
jgi:hypothetical protein